MKLVTMKSCDLYFNPHVLFTFTVIVGLLNFLGSSPVECRSSGDARVLTGWNKIPVESDLESQSESDTGFKNGWTTWEGNISDGSGPGPFASVTVPMLEKVSGSQQPPSLYLVPPPKPTSTPMPVQIQSQSHFQQNLKQKSKPKPKPVTVAASLASPRPRPGQVKVVAPHVIAGPNYIVAASNLVGSTSNQIVSPIQLDKIHQYMYSQSQIQTQSQMNTITEKAFTPLNVPSIANHRLTGNWSEEVKVGGNEIQTGVATTALKPVYPGPGSGSRRPSKVRRKVSVEKFRECIFFRICPKSECFHFGRFGVCQGY